MIPGVDVWAGYGVIDWRKVYQSGVRFAFMKASEGNEPGRNDRYFRRNVDEAKAAGIFVGAYHVPWPLPPRADKPGRSPSEQAERAYEVTGGLGEAAGELPLVADAEWPEVGQWGKWDCSAQQISDWLQEFCARATALWGRPPIIYTYPFWWKALAAGADVSWAADFHLWIANYKHNGPGVPPPTARPELPKPWPSWTFWQYSAEGSLERVPGIPACPVDRDVFAGSFDDLRRLANIDPDEETQPSMPIPAVDFPIVHRLPNTVPSNDDDEGGPDAA